MRKILPLLVVTAVLLTPLYPVYAQGGTPAASVKRIGRPNAATAAAKLDAARAKLAQAQDNVMDRMDAMKDKMASRAAELKAKLAKFKDRNKANRVEMVNSTLASINQRRTTQMQASLDKISQLLNRVKTWAAKEKEAGKDVTDLEKAIADTEAAWTEASNAVKTQSENDYTIEVNSESTVKADSMVARDKLHNDLKAVHDKIVNVRKTLADALSSWNNGGGN